MRFVRVLAIVALSVTSTRAGAQQPLPASVTGRIDAVFARYNRADSPGCAVGVYQNGAITYAMGYGSANLEYGIPITANTPFISGSVAKQFTAAAIALLVEQGRISLDDDVRKYIPELPNYGTKVTIDHLVHHTSGLRDFWALVDVSGMRFDDGYTAGDVIRLAARQKQLNFPPGSEYAYSNTGYVSLGVVVQRVTGKSLREFAAEEIFKPLGMTSTHYHDDHTMIVPGRAAAYAPLTGGGWRVNIWNNDMVGQGGMMTTVTDLQKWDENFYTGKVGGPGFLERQLQQGKLTNGSVLPYAFGLTVTEYRGLPLVEHGGSSGGYRTIISRFPAHHTSVVALCNSSDIDATALGHRVADVVLESKFTKPVPPTRAGGSSADTPAPASMKGVNLKPYTGRFYSQEVDATYELSTDSGALVVKRPRGEIERLQMIDARTFRSGGMTYRFAPNAGGVVPSFTIDIARVRGLAFVRTTQSR
jgi:CubicO group peptidase (beta-lactamase class C family)